MIARNETLRRIAYAMALLTGVMLVGSQFGCSRPTTFLHSVGFPHAGRWAASYGEPAGLAPALYWTSPRPTSEQRSRATLVPAPMEGSGRPVAPGLTELSANPTDTPPFSAEIEGAQ